MVVTNEEIAKQIKYLKDNHFMPNINKEGKAFKNMIKSLYSPQRPRITDDLFVLLLSYGAFNVTDKFVRDVNKSYKRFQILNIGKGEF